MDRKVAHTLPYGDDVIAIVSESSVAVKERGRSWIQAVRFTPALLQQWLFRGINVTDRDLSGHREGIRAITRRTEVGYPTRWLNEDENSYFMSRFRSVQRMVDEYIARNPPPQPTGQSKEVGENSWFLINVPHTSSSIDELIRNGIDVNTRNANGGTLLHYQKYPEVVQALVDAGADVNAKRNDKMSPLRIAVRRGRTEVCNVLMLAGADVHETNGHGGTLLHDASEIGAFEIAKNLLQAKANPNAINSRGQTPLYLAVRNGHIAVTKLLLELGASANAVAPSGGSCLHRLPYQANLSCFNALVKAGADVNARNRSTGNAVIHEYVLRRDIRLLRKLLEHDVDLNLKNNEGLTALELASTHFPGAVDLLKRRTDGRGHVDLNKQWQRPNSTRMHPSSVGVEARTGARGGRRGKFGNELRERDPLNEAMDLWGLPASRGRDRW